MFFFQDEIKKTIIRNSKGLNSRLVYSSSCPDLIIITRELKWFRFHRLHLKTLQLFNSHYHLNVSSFQLNKKSSKSSSTFLPIKHPEIKFVWLNCLSACDNDNDDINEVK